jgi:hypothetical protein
LREKRAKREVREVAINLLMGGIEPILTTAKFLGAEDPVAKFIDLDWGI